MSFTFKDYLIEDVKKGKKKDKKKDKKKGKEKEEVKFFNPQRFVPKMEKVLDQLIKKSAMEGEMANELIILEMISIFKEVLSSRLEPYKDPSYAERKNEDTVATMGTIKEEILDVLRTHFSEPEMRSANNTFMTLIVDPIISEIVRVTPAQVVHLLDTSRFDHKAKDAFGHLARYIVNSVIIPNAEDAQVAQKVLIKWGADARRKQRKERKLTKAQRLAVIRNAVEKVQGEAE